MIEGFNQELKVQDQIIIVFSNSNDTIQLLKNQVYIKELSTLILGCIS